MVTDETSAVPADLDLDRVPAHIACVMDGNGRWASQRGLPRTEGHAAGEVALLDAVDGALEIGVQWLTMFAFSTENWRRPRDEVRYLMGFNESLLVRRRDELHEKGVRIRFAGRRDWRVPRRVLRRMDESAALTKGNRKMSLTISGQVDLHRDHHDLALSGILRDSRAAGRSPDATLTRPKPAHRAY